MAHRLLWSAVFCIFVLLRRGQLTTAAKLFFDRTKIGPLILSSILIGTNWLSYIYALSQGKALEAALAYFICPLLSVALGAIFLRERISKQHFLPLMLITVGVGMKMFETGGFPIMALIIGGSFSAYALNKKRLNLEPTQGMFAETVLLAGPAVAYLFFNSSSAALNISQLALFISTGAVTVVPMVLFAAALSTVSMRFVGMAQYIAPTLMFLVAVVVYGQPVTLTAALSFIFIWSGIAFSVFGQKQGLTKATSKFLAEPAFAES